MCLQKAGASQAGWRSTKMSYDPPHLPSYTCSGGKLQSHSIIWHSTTFSIQSSEKAYPTASAMDGTRTPGLSTSSEYVERVFFKVGTIVGTLDMIQTM